MNRSRIRAAIFVYWGYVLIVTFYPFELSPDYTLSFDHLAGGFLTLVFDSWRWLGKTDFVLNILLFLPCGAFLHSLWQGRHRSQLSTLVLVTLCGTLASFVIEFSQLFAFRNSSALDVLANTLGTAVGGLAYAGCKRRGIDPLDGCSEYLSSKVVLCTVMLFAALPLVFSAEQLISPFWRWDSKYSLQIGNEATLNRPWLGKIYLVALYRRALSPDEVANNFTAGFAAVPLTSRVQKDLIALYEFAERAGNIVHDTASFGAPLDLKFVSSSRVRWLADSAGIEIVRRSIVRSQGPASKLVEALKQTNELSLEVWMASHNTTQGGPAQIVSLSQNSEAHNFTLGQDGADIHFRLRTPVSGHNRAPVGLRTTDRVLSRDISHVIVTYKAGIERLYVNGAQRPETVNMARDAIIGFGTRKTGLSQLAYSFFYFLPASLVFSVFVSTRTIRPVHRWILSVAVAAALAGTTEFIQAFTLARAIEPKIIWYGVLIGFGGASTGTLFAQTRGDIESLPVRPERALSEA